MIRFPFGEECSPDQMLYVRVIHLLSKRNSCKRADLIIRSSMILSFGRLEKEREVQALPDENLLFIV